MRSFCQVFRAYHNIANLAHLDRKVIPSQAVILRPFWPDQVRGAAYDNIRLIESGVDRLTMDRYILPVLDEFILIAVKLQPPGFRVMRLMLIGLLPPHYLRICARHE